MTMQLFTGVHSLTLRKESSMKTLRVLAVFWTSTWYQTASKGAQNQQDRGIEYGMRSIYV